ncbi:MAG: lytic transglycosylase domain-containing protein [Alphaproteobacteria bacterium]|nr:lytic transglycosylase domain-containing protein [Alphaproteobacteria bacterium]
MTRVFEVKFSRRGSILALAVAGLVFGPETGVPRHAVAKAPPAPAENPKRDIEALKSLQTKEGVLRLPEVVTKAEERHNEAFDEFIKPVRETPLSVEQADKLRQSKKSADEGNFVDLLLVRGELSDPVAVKIVDWLMLRKGEGTIEAYRKFLDENPTWPNRWLLIEHLEQKLLKLDNPEITIAAFESIAPETAIGKAALAVALAKSGRLEEARKLAGQTWRNSEMSTAVMTDLKARLGELISAEDVAARAKADTTASDAKWGKTRSKAYDDMKAGKFKSAYKKIESAKGLSINPRNERVFLLGWLALRYLGDTDAAKTHFSSLRKSADGPLSRSKAAYWLGRAHEADGDTAAADKHYRDAFTAQNDTFHAHLARQRVSKGPQDIEINPPQVPTAEQVQRFRSLDSVKAAVIADKAGLGRDITRPFVANLGNIFETEGEVALIAHLTRELGDTQQSLRIGKSAISRGMNLIYYAYPLHAFPDYKPLRKPPEPAFLLSVARQESEFNTGIVSRAGARGILQVMPVTAKHVCNDYKIKCELGRLLTDESYNTKLSSAYIADRMEEFGGSYVLGLAGYNAGPGRARQWIRQIGDPRDALIDEIDWIERIPFWETRNYVAKVLSNIQMYRARLGEAQPLRLEDDLMRAKEHKRAEKRFAPGSKGLQVSAGK